MTIKKIKNADKLTLAVEGRLETITAPELESVVNSELDGVTALTFDFSDLDYISSAGLRILLSAQKVMRKQGSMEIIGANEIVKEIFEITGFLDILTIR